MNLNHILYEAMINKKTLIDNQDPGLKELEKQI